MGMKRALGILILLCLLATACGAAEPTTNDGAETFPALLEKAKQMDPKLDFIALRMAYIKTPQYSSKSPLESESLEAHRLFKDEKFDDCIKAARGVISQDPLSIRGHMLLFMAYKALGNEQELNRNRYLVRGLLGSIEKSGDGTRESPYVVISVDEEYDFMNYKGVKSKQINLIKEDKRYLDAHSTVNLKTKEEGAIYFDCTIPFKQMEKEMIQKMKKTNEDA